MMPSPLMGEGQDGGGCTQVTDCIFPPPPSSPSRGEEKRKESPSQLAVKVAVRSTFVWPVDVKGSVYKTVTVILLTQPPEVLNSKRPLLEAGLQSVDLHVGIEVLWNVPVLTFVSSNVSVSVAKAHGPPMSLGYVALRTTFTRFSLSRS